MPRTCSLALEILEDRTSPAVFGLAWPDGANLTLSLVPDGGESALYAHLDAQQATAAWQTEILRAFQTWAVHANLNIGLVGDGGQPLGAGGALQGDSRFGDIRISAGALSPEVLAVSMPFDVTAGTWAGDVRLNTQYLFGTEADGRFDLFSVVLHEAGHVFGIAGSDDPASPMFQHYGGTRTELTAGDIAALQALYGARAPDAFEGKAGNDSRATAAALRPSTLTGTTGTLGVTGDLTTPGDVDYYSFKADAGPVTVRLRTAGLSLLVPRLTVFNAVGEVLTTLTAAAPGTGDLTFQLDPVKANATYYFEVAGGAAGVFGMGGYRLEVASPSTALVAGAPLPTGSLPYSGEGITNDTLATATPLRQKIFTTDARFDYTVRADFWSAADVDVYRFRAPKPADGQTNVMRAMVWSQETGSDLRPTLAVFDALGNPVAAEVLVNENGTYTVQAGSTRPNVDYFVSVRATAGSGDYFLGIDFGDPATRLDPVADGALTADDAVHGGILQVDQSQLFHFVLSADSGLATDQAVRLTFWNEDGQLVASLAVRDGETLSTTLFLTQGTYLVRVEVEGTGPSAAPLAYQLRAIGLSDPIGPQASDSSTDPVSPDSSTTSPSALYWWTYGYYTYLLGLSGTK